jgi:quinoprotein glucose dehydrogenase
MIALRVFAAFLMIVGLIVGGLGAWLATLGGSPYYVIAGIVLLVAGALLARGLIAGIWLYAALFVATLAWALWEVGLDGWALLPRLAAPAVVMVIALLFIPVLRRAPRVRAVAAAR